MPPVTAGASCGSLDLESERARPEPAFCSLIGDSALDRPIVGSALHVVG